MKISINIEPGKRDKEGENKHDNSFADWHRLKASQSFVNRDKAINQDENTDLSG